jgi:putative DNA primase/helicase
VPSEALRRFVQRVVGYAAAGVVSEEILAILYGVGANGKSTLVNAVMDSLGDYAIQAAPDPLMAKRGAHPTELADLFGARFVASVESEEGRRLAESLVKQLTGRDRVKARRMREDFWQFDPTHTTFLATNHKPEVSCQRQERYRLLARDRTQIPGDLLGQK